MYKTIRQTVTFSAPPTAVYRLLMDADKHAAFTESEVSISRDVGGAFSIWGGALSGINLELVAGRRIVQAWRASGWPEGHLSTAVFELAKTGAGCKLTFTQYGVPVAHAESIRDGWKQFYWAPMKRWIAARKRG